ncbi:MAG: class I SAM-dependent methyltransferase [Methanomassiliicoccus sp.]|nr:class I SAM-dependent methyltransferase [Methanomassiliicoccus sp.]
MADKDEVEGASSRGSGDQETCWDREYSCPHPMWKGPPKDDLGLELAGVVLELGCGNGKTAAVLVRTASSVVALDFSRVGLRSCRLAVPSPGLELVRGDLRSLPFADRTFDHVVASHVLGHLLQDERRRAMDEIIRVLVPGGTLVLRAFSVKDMRCGQGQEIEAGTFRRGTGIRNHFFSGEELRVLTVGLEEVTLEESVSSKRYGGREMTRAEWSGIFRVIRDGPQSKP